MRKILSFRRTRRFAKRTRRFVFNTKKAIQNRKQRLIGNIKSRWRKFIIRFKPKYNVDVTLYHFIPGMPVTTNYTRHHFNKGEFHAAKLFFDKASEKTKNSNVAPVEINLVRGRRRVLISRHFGPIKSLKQMRLSA